MATTKIFIIDDEQSVVRLLMEYFNRLDYKCEGFFFDRDLLTSIREFMPDVIICDMNLQTTSGLEILSQIKQNIDLADISFVFLTGSINAEAIQKGFEMGADECLRKPLDLAEINNQVCHVLNRKQNHHADHLNILTIDQNEERLDKLVRLLSERGHLVLKAKKLAEARKIIAKNNIDIVLSSSTFIDGDVLNFYESAQDEMHNKYFTLMLDANEFSLANKARGMGVNDFVYINYGDNYLRGKLMQIIKSSNARRFKNVYSLKEIKPESILKSCEANAFSGDIFVRSQEGSGTISMCNGKYIEVSFNGRKKSNALEIISSLTEGEMIIKQKKFEIN